MPRRVPTGRVVESARQVAHEPRRSGKSARLLRTEPVSSFDDRQLVFDMRPYNARFRESKGAAHVERLKT